MHRRIYGYISAHSRTAVFALVVILSAEAAFVAWQKSQYENFMERLLSPGALAAGVLITGEKTNDGLFGRTDRLHLTLATSLYSKNPADPPLTLDLDMTADFGPFGLTGDVFLLNATTGSAKLLKLLEGTHPRLSLRWSLSTIHRAMKLTASATPFDMRTSYVKPGVGPISWRFASAKPVECGVTVPESGAISGGCKAPALLASLTDPAANITEVEWRQVEASWSAVKTNAAQTFEEAPAETPAARGVWYVDRADLKAEQADFSSGDWRGVLKLAFKNFKAEAHQDPAPDMEVLDGRYSVDASRALISVLSHSKDFHREVDARDLVLRVKAADVPLKLFDAVDDESIEETLDQAGPMHFELSEFGFASGQGGRQKTSAKGALEVLRQSGKLQETNLHLEAELPDAVVDILDVIIKGARPDAKGQSIRRFMTQRRGAPGTAGEESKDGAVWNLRMQETRRGALTARAFTVDKVQP